MCPSVALVAVGSRRAGTSRPRAGSPSTNVPIHSSRCLRLATALLLVAYLVVLLAGLPELGVPGSDESAHGFQALRFATALRAGDLEAFGRELVRPATYPPFGRLALALGFLFGDVGFAAPRVTSCLAFVATLWLATRLVRRLVDAEDVALAEFVTVLLCGLSWLSVQYARTAFLETWCGFAFALGALLLVRATEAPSRTRIALCGAFVGCELLVKYSYGFVFLVAVVCALAPARLRFPAFGPVALRAGVGRESEQFGWLRFGAWLGGGAAAIWVWWFVLPWPGDRELGAAHRSIFVDYLTGVASLEGLRVQDLAILWPFAGSHSLIAFGVQCLGIACACGALGTFAPRLLFALALSGPIGFCAYPYRIERFLVPTLFAGAVLGGAVAAAWLGRLRPRTRALVGGGLVCACVATPVLGRWSVVAAIRNDLRGPAEVAAVSASVERWNYPFARLAAPSAGPPGIERLLARAVPHLEVRRPFVWIGGGGAELSPWLLRWSAFQFAPEREALAWEAPEAVQWTDPGWDRATFESWAATFEQVVTMDPTDLRGRRTHPYETSWVRWMADHPSFRIEASEVVRMDNGREHAILFYRRIEGPVELPNGSSSDRSVDR